MKPDKTDFQILKARRHGRAALLLALLAVGRGACFFIPREPGPSAIAAAEGLAADIKSFRASRDLGIDLSTPALETFARVYDRVRRNYVREVDEAVLMTAARETMRKEYPDPNGVADEVLVMSAIRGMLASLDRYSSYLSPRDWRDMRDKMRGEFHGLGIEVRKGKDGIEVISPIDGTPAKRAGLRTGDVLTHADGKSLGGISLRAGVLMLRGKAGTAVVLTIRRGEATRFDVRVVREVIQLASVRHRRIDEIGYLRIGAFTRDVSDQVEAAMESLKDRGDPMKGLIIDFRSNPGGSFDESVEVSDYFLEAGRIVSTKGRTRSAHHSAEQGDLAHGLPIVVLINGGSASAAEIVAGALRDHHRATIVGTKSFGKGTVQTIIPLGANDALRLTTAIYLTPSGQSVDGGIEPDIRSRMDKNRDGDEQLQRALEVVREMAAAS